MAQIGSDLIMIKPGIGIPDLVDYSLVWTQIRHFLVEITGLDVMSEADGSIVRG